MVARAEGVSVVVGNVADVLDGLQVTVGLLMSAAAGETLLTTLITLITSDMTIKPIEFLYILFMLVSLI